MKLTQSKLSTQMRESGRTRYWRSVQEQVDAGRESDTQHARRLMQAMLPQVLARFEAWLKEANTGAGRGHAALPVLTSVEPAVACFLGFRGVFDSLNHKGGYSAVAHKIGGSIETEARLGFYYDTDKEFFKFLEGRLKKMGMTDVMRRSRFIHGEFRERLQKEGKADFDSFGKTRHANAGTVLIEILVETTGLFEIAAEGKGKASRKFIRGTEAFGQWVAGFHAHAEYMTPMWMPCIQPIDPWVVGAVNCPTGTLSEVHSLPMVKTRSTEVIDRLNTEPMTEVFSAINALQDTAWRINKRVLEVAQVAWDQDWAVGLPPRAALAMPVKPSDIDTNEEAKKAWKKAAAKVHTIRNQSKGTLAQGGALFAVASKLVDSEALYFPHQADFRGRLYPVPGTLNPQGCDLSKALLEFSEGKTITHPSEADWLAIHGANLWGIDKVSMEDRIAWVLANRNDILASAADPESHRWWTQADGGDKAWQFLAFCFEWSDWLTKGVGVVTHLPVSVDGSNNGLQILSLLCRDELGGKLTNVSPSDLPQDVYGEVAKATVRSILADTENEDGVVRQLADIFTRSLEINRKTTKRQVMVLPYGGTFSSCLEYTREWLNGAVAKCDTNPFGDDSKLFNAGVTYLARKIWESIGVFVGRPRQVMAWLQDTARKVTETGRAIEWHTPTGFLAVQRYLKMDHKMLNTFVGKRIRVQHTVETKELDARRQAQGIAPNYVHSLDASAMCRTINLCLRSGVKDFAMVHDSYGTHATNMSVLAGALRYAFASMFGADLLAQFKAEIEGTFGVTLDPLPTYGSLNPSDVSSSEFFFA
jgi:DNA-directed RNA polymerase, mitochondrial